MPYDALGLVRIDRGELAAGASLSSTATWTRGASQRSLLVTVDGRVSDARAVPLRRIVDRGHGIEEAWTG